MFGSKLRKAITTIGIFDFLSFYSSRPLCFSPMIVVNGLNAAEEGGASLMAQIGRGLIFLAGLLTPAMWTAVGAALLLVLVALSALCYLRIGVHA